MLRNGPAGLPGDVIANPLYHAPPRFADAISRIARRRAIGDLTEFGLPIPEEGPFTRLRRLRAVPLLVDLDVIDAIRDGSIVAVAAAGQADRLTEVRRLEHQVRDQSLVIEVRLVLDVVCDHDRPSAPSPNLQATCIATTVEGCGGYARLEAQRPEEAGRR